MKSFFLSPFAKKFYPPLLVLLITVFIGAGGYILIDDYPVFEAFYMTITTITSVGFGEIIPLSTAGRAFTMCLVIVSCGAFTYSISTLTSILISKDFKNYIKLSRMEQKISQLEGHIVICGLGRNGRSVVNSLKGSKATVVIIESNPDKLEDFQDYLHVIGNATDEDILVKANVSKAKALISALPKDTDNVYVVLTAKELNPKITVISRAAEEHAESKLKRAGATHVIMPEKIGGEYMSYIITKPDVLNFLDFINDYENISFEEISLSSFPNINQVSLRQLDIRHKTGINIMGVKSEKGEFTVNPGTNTILTQKCKLIAFGTKEQMNELKKYFTDFKVVEQTNWGNE